MIDATLRFELDAEGRVRGGTLPEFIGDRACALVHGESELALLHAIVSGDATRVRVSGGSGTCAYHPAVARCRRRPGGGYDLTLELVAA